MYYCASSIYSGPIYNNFKTSKRTFRREHRKAADKHVYFMSFFMNLIKQLKLTMLSFGTLSIKHVTVATTRQGMTSHSKGLVVKVMRRF